MDFQPTLLRVMRKMAIKYAISLKPSLVKYFDNLAKNNANILLHFVNLISYMLSISSSSNSPFNLYIIIFIEKNKNLCRLIYYKFIVNFLRGVKNFR